jgi:hypothetical protein
MRIRRKKTLVQQAVDYVEHAAEKAGPILAEAKEQVESALAEAREQAAPAIVGALDGAKAKAGPALADVRDKATPLVASGAALAAEKASAAAEAAAEKAARTAAHGRDVASAKAAELVGKPRKKHRLRTMVILTGIAALVGFVVKRLKSGGDRANWQSSYTPTPPPSPSATTQTPIGDAAEASTAPAATDEGGASPDEALADAVDESRDVTTPDDPADVVELEPGEEAAAKRSGP